MQPDSYTDHQPQATPLERAQAKREEIRQIAEQSVAAIHRSTPVNPYEDACARYRKAVEDRSTAKARAAKLIDDADDELEAAEASLRQYEQRPGIALPEYRTAAA